MIGVWFGWLQEVYVVTNKLDCAGIPSFFFLPRQSNFNFRGSGWQRIRQRYLFFHFYSPTLSPTTQTFHFDHFLLG